MAAVDPPGSEGSGAQAITPDAWRVAALGLLAGGFAVGVLSGHRRLGGAVPLITAGVALGCAVPVALASRRPPITPRGAADALSRADRMPTFSIARGCARRSRGPAPARGRRQPSGLPWRPTERPSSN